MKSTTGHLHKRAGRWYLAYQADGKRYDVRIVDAEGRPVTNKGDARKLADDHLRPYRLTAKAETLAALAAKAGAAQAAADHAAGSLRVVEAWQAFASSPSRPDCGPATLRQYLFQFEAFQEWAAGHMGKDATLREVTAGTAADYARHLAAEGRAAGTFNKHLNLLSLVWRTLREPAQLEGDPWATIRRKSVMAQSRRELTVEEIRRVCGTATGETRILFALGIYSGLRLGDCATLQWSDVDIVRGAIRRVPNKTGRKNPKPVIVPLHPVLRAILEETPPAARRGAVLPKSAAEYAKHSGTLTNRIQAHFEANGIQTIRPGTGVTVEAGPDGKPVRASTGKRAVVEVGFHSLRHSFVSLCRAAGAPLSVVESIVGHSNPAMTRYYTHTGEEAAGVAVAALPTVFDGVAVPMLPAPVAVDWRAEVRRIAAGLPRSAAKQRAEFLALADA